MQSSTFFFKKVDLLILQFLQNSEKNPLLFGIANRNSYRILKMSTHTKNQMTVELFPNDQKLQ